jgi:type IV pilus assembly protein PilY1
MSKRLGILCLLTALCAWPGSTALADDSDIFLQTSVPPNVALLIDTSGSMNDEVDGVDKIEIAKSAMVDLVTQVEGVNFAVFAFNATGARMVAPFGTDPAVIAAKISALSAQGGTPLGRATRHIKYYFRGEWNGIDSTRDMDGSAYDDDCADGDDETMGCEAVYFGDHAVLMTDGMPNGEDVNLVAAQALEMFSQDHNSILDGKQNIIVNTIGFDVPAGAALLTTTANNGGGTFYTASNAAELRAALQASVIQAVEGSYSFSMPLVPSSRVADGDKVYVATFEPNLVAPFWEGKLLAYNRDGAGHVPVDADGLPLDSAIAWDAGALLDTRAASDRNLKTVIGGAVQDFDRSNSNLTKALLGVATDGERDDIIDFIRGIDTFDADVDGNDTEEREWKLGDIFHSKPVLVFPPPLDSPDDDYDTFKANNESRATIVLVGANDGMIHAFQASNGAELWGLVPPDLLDELGDLTPSLGDHVYYVDSSPIVADVKLNGTWKTIAVFGERRGGRSYHALDITNTSSPSYLWGFTDVDMGESWSEPRLGKIKMDGGAEKNVMFFGGGYDTTNNNASGKAFYVVDLADGSLLWKYENTASDDSQYMNFSLPASPTAADLNGDGFVDRVYAGDVGGQLWKFDVSEQLDRQAAVRRRHHRSQPAGRG